MTFGWLEFHLRLVFRGPGPNFGLRSFAYNHLFSRSTNDSVSPGLVNPHVGHRHHNRMFMRHFDSKTSKLLEEDQHSPWFKIVLCSPAIALFLLLSWMVLSVYRSSRSYVKEMEESRKNSCGSQTEISQIDSETFIYRNKFI